MKTLAPQKQHQDIRRAAQKLLEHGIAVTGPYRRRNGTLVFSLAECVVTEDELLRIHRDGELSATGIQELFAEIDRRSS
jgi:hypothetical protein